MILSHVDQFTFNWHNAYVYADDAAPLLPKGTVMKITAWHDNTAANKANPDPNVWVGYGDRTVDEMGHAWVNVTYLTTRTIAAEVEARSAGSPRLSQRTVRSDARSRLSACTLAARRGRGGDSWCWRCRRAQGGAAAPRATAARAARRDDEAIFPAFEGWGPRQERRATLILLGYYNRNKTQALDIPIGPDNRIDPGGPDYGQPTHFDAGPPARRVRDQSAEGLRHQEAHVDADGERPDLVDRPSG